jgi:hypothetical protein
MFIFLTPETKFPDYVVGDMVDCGQSRLYPPVRDKEFSLILRGLYNKCVLTVCLIDWATMSNVSSAFN